MDLLASLNVDELPEQQTRMLHLLSTFPDFDGQLGFDCCACCGNKLDTIVECPNCKSIKYCSTPCREKDSEPLPPQDDDDDDENHEQALGHSALICTLLRVCRDDEAVENKEDMERLDSKTISLSRERIQSELESYPATLANLLLSGPAFVHRLKQCSDTIVVHVIGASQEVEMWSQGANVWDAYADALAEVVELYHVHRIKLYFIGPDCPKSKSNDANLSTVTLSTVTQGRIEGSLEVYSIQGGYTTNLLEQYDCPVPDAVFFFNPGFTVPDYSWNDAIASIPAGTPFVSTTNTELEGVADAQYLLDQDKIQTIPVGLADMLGLYSGGDDDDDDDNHAADDEADSDSFFSVNPFCGSRVRQSGTMANDLYVKNRWMLGGIMDSYKSSTKSESLSKRRRVVGQDDNTKKSNPALI